MLPNFTRFKQRHNEKIFTQILDSREAARTRVKTEDVLHYSGKVADALGRIRSLKQMINMDESGFCSRMDKGRKRKCVVSKSCEISPTFQEEDGSSQLTIVSTISLSGDALCPMFITKEQIKVNGNFANDSIFARSLKQADSSAPCDVERQLPNHHHEVVGADGIPLQGPRNDLEQCLPRSQGYCGTCEGELPGFCGVCRSSLADRVKRRV